MNGCERDAPHEVFKTSCTRCSGANSECTECHGSGVKIWHRCPAKVVTPDVWAFMDTYAAYDRHGTLPVAGAWEDQSRVWTRLVRIADSERAAIEEERRPKGKRSED